MATVLLSAAGAAVGGMLGGSALGLSSVVIGRFIGGVVGNAIDQRILGRGSQPVETGRIDRYRITGSGEGAAIPQLYGKLRLGGQVIWATQFAERVSTSGGGKGAPSGPTVKEYSYSVSLALALCEGEITGVTRLWADGEEIAITSVTMHVYRGSQDQPPDSKMEAIEGAGQVPAYRGIAYVVFEDLDLERWGNRVPQFSFEVSRPTPIAQQGAEIEPTHAAQGVALIPGSGEYALATTPVYYEKSAAENSAANVNSPSGESDFVTATQALTQELPQAEAVSLVVSWFGSDLRCADCEIRPKVESALVDGSTPWRVAGETRSSADVIPESAGRPVYGGTPTDQSVIEAITHLKSQGQTVMYYPFILMDQVEGNGLPDPWSDNEDQPVLPWRGRITLSVAPGREGSPDGTSQAEAEVATFFGTAAASDFSVSGDEITYSGPAEWRFRRFILHQAALCKAAGGVAAFCIGSEMRSLTWLRGQNNRFTAVHELIALAAEVRALLGDEVKIGYAADWSEYFGYHPQDGSGDVFFHLDPLWADGNIDFIGIDNYMPLSDWRDGPEHLDADWGSLYNLDYLQDNIEGGEGFDWFYHSQEARDAQIRSTISDGAYQEPWIYRYKDMRNWWQNAHHERIGGVRQEMATDWLPESKPIWFTEIGCAAIDKGTNAPNKFLDPKSSESTLPHYSNGLQDSYIQHQYLAALYGYWGDLTRNPVSTIYDAPMIDMARAFVWAWDTRPYPWFPNHQDLWSDGANYTRGHWISGRTTARPLASVVREICETAGLTDIDVSDLVGMVSGYIVTEVGEPRKALQPLMTLYGFDAVERDGVLVFLMRGSSGPKTISHQSLAVDQTLENGVAFERAAQADMVGRVQLGFIESGADYDAISEEGILSDEETRGILRNEVAVAMSRGEGRNVTERWLAEARLARDTARLALPPSALGLGAGDLIRISTETEETGPYRIDRVELGTQLGLEAVAVEPAIYDPIEIEDLTTALSAYDAPTPVLPFFMDLPLLTGDEIPHAPHVAATAIPWSGSVAVYDSPDDETYALNLLLTGQATVGTLQETLYTAAPWRIDRAQSMNVDMISGALENTSYESLLAGANLALIGDGTPDRWEVVQFQSAELNETGSYVLSGLLRGQLGTEAIAAQDWPQGSWFVLFNAALQQIDLASSLRLTERHFRIGPAQAEINDASYRHEIHAFAGIGLRPYAPVHLRAQRDALGDLSLTWVRRTRIDGDSWDLADVPLGEETEQYRITVYKDGVLLREENISQPDWTYSIADQTTDLASGTVTFQVAQVSARFGPGDAASLVFTL